MATKPLVGAEPQGDVEPPDALGPPATSASTRLLPSPIQLRSLARRLASIVALVAIDVGGLAGALYLALVLRELYYGERPVLWGLPWKAEAEWLPFLVLVTVLVFWRGGLYAPREQRAGAGRVVSSLLLVTVITLAFAVGTGYQHTTFGLYVTAFVLSVVVDRRPARRVRARDARRVAARRRAPARRARSARASGSSTCAARSASGAAASTTSSSARRHRRRRPSRPAVARRGRATCRSVLERLHPDELIVSGVDLGDEELLDLVEQAHRSGVKVRIAPTTTELLTQRAEYVPGQGVPLFELRPPVFAGLDWATKRVVRPRRERADRRRRRAVLGARSRSR